MQQSYLNGCMIVQFGLWTTKMEEGEEKAYEILENKEVESDVPAFDI